MIKVIVEALTNFLGIFPNYPTVVRGAFITWLMMSAGLAALLIYYYPVNNNKPTQKSELIMSIDEKIKQAFEVPDKYTQTYSDILEKGNSGIIKVLSSRDIELERLGVGGGGIYYSFVRRTHSYGHGSDIKISDGKFSNGFAGWNFGYFLNLGETPIRLVIDTAGVDPPSWLDTDKIDAWRYMWEFRPPTDEKSVREHQQNARSLRIGRSVISESIPILKGNTYLLRSIQYRNSDILTVIYVEEVGSLDEHYIVWKILKIFDTPA